MFGFFKRKNKVSPSKSNNDDSGIEMSYEEIMKFVSEFVKEESRDSQLRLIEKQEIIAKAHTCSVHGKALVYNYSLDGVTASLNIKEKCCDQSLTELANKLN